MKKALSTILTTSAALAGMLYHTDSSTYQSKQPCFFCSTSGKSIITENMLAYAIYDDFPVTPYHTLIIPKRHVRTYLDLTPEETIAIHELIVNQSKILMHIDKSIEGFNIGMNCGPVAGQTIFHCHVHLIPRRSGDVENPRGGVRNIIPGKGNYQKRST